MNISDINFQNLPNHKIRIENFPKIIRNNI